MRLSKRATTLRKGLALLLAAGLASTVAACSGSDSGANADGPAKGAIQLAYWGSSTRVDKTNKILADFKKEYPDVSVNPSVTDFGTYFQKLNTQAASKSMPCVAGMQTRQLNDYTSNQTLVPLDDLVKSGKLDMKDVPKSILDSGRGPDGKLYMIPYGVAWNAFLVNKTVADKYDIPDLKEGYTWDEWLAWLKQAKSKLPKDVAPILEQGGNEALFSAYVLSNGQKMFNDQGKVGFSKQSLTEYWTMWENLRRTGLTNSMQNAASEPDQIEQHAVIAGKVLMQGEAGNQYVAAIAAAPDVKLTEHAFPSGSSGLGNMFFTSGWSIPKNCDNQAAAAAFIDYWTNNDNAAKIYASDNGAVANKRQLQDQIDNPSSPGLEVVLKNYQYILSEDVPNPVIPPGYNASFETSFEREYENVAFGKKSIKQAVDDFFAAANSTMGNKS
ncbi:ABC transporter substrate-binding protein [Microlunatus soli]|uniref:Multiple sugar transport system substrate-binding protein n=1 Tax=Microlunatus soli TaxID=630515 RepID=A0A1H1ZP49_9ACTN|nr:extracellular solute-binding protein [Microlunatus soli]SDT35498.1 multiple sugar transport system substrate-binding protein [Microlunatus soli]